MSSVSPALITYGALTSRAGGGGGDGRGELAQLARRSRPVVCSRRAPARFRDRYLASSPASRRESMPSLALACTIRRPRPDLALSPILATHPSRKPCEPPPPNSRIPT